MIGLAFLEKRFGCLDFPAISERSDRLEGIELIVPDDARDYLSLEAALADILYASSQTLDDLLLDIRATGENPVELKMEASSSQVVLVVLEEVLVQLSDDKLPAFVLWHRVPRVGVVPPRKAIVLLLRNDFHVIYCNDALRSLSLLFVLTSVVLLPGIEPWVPSSEGPLCKRDLLFSAQDRVVGETWCRGLLVSGVQVVVRCQGRDP